MPANGTGQGERLRERVYGVLLVSSSQSFNRTMLDVFPFPSYDPVEIVGSVAAAERALESRSFDFVVVNSPLPDSDGIRFCADIGCGPSGMPVLLMIPGEQYEETADYASSRGIFLLPKPVSRSALSTGLQWMASARERLRMTESKVQSVEEKMNEIRLVNRAKWLLISQLQMSEPDAHKYIGKQAMDRCVTRRAVAEEIIRTYG